MGLFKGKKISKKVVPATAPEEPETDEEIEYTEELDKDTEKTPEQNPMEYREIPVCLSQAQVNNMIIENNIMLKQIVAEI